MTKFLQGNVRSLNTSCRFVEDICLKEQIKVLSLSEIWHPDVTNINFLHQWKWYKSVRVGQEGGGAAVIVCPDIKSVPRREITADVEMVWCELYIRNTALLLGSVYVRPGDRVAMAELIKIMNSLKDRNIIVTGDLNAKHTAWFNDDVNTLGEDLNEFINASDYIVMNDEVPTYQNSIIDLTLVKGCTNLFSEWNVKPNVYRVTM